MWMKIRLGWLVVGISTVVIGFLAGQWPFALVAIVATWLVDGVLRVKARGMLPDDESEWNGLTDWLKRFGQALVQHRSVAYLILMATMIVHYMRPFDVVLGLLVRVGVMVAIEAGMAYVAEEKEVRKAQGRRPMRRKQPRRNSTFGVSESIASTAKSKRVSSRRSMPSPWRNSTRGRKVPAGLISRIRSATTSALGRPRVEVSAGSWRLQLVSSKRSPSTRVRVPIPARASCSAA